MDHSEAARFDRVFARPQVSVERRPGGVVVLGSGIDVPPYDPVITRRLGHWARLTPDSVFLAERCQSGWREISYGQMERAVAELAGRLLAMDLSPSRPLMILAPNSIAHAQMAFAAMSVGIPAAPVSTAYAASAGGLAKLEQVAKVLKPGAIYLGNPETCEEAAKMLARLAPLISAADHPALGVRAMDRLERAPAGAVASAAAGVDGSTIARILFTSGSTGTPKGVINTHDMLASNQASTAAVWLRMTEAPPRLTSWLPWNHTFGGNFCLNLALYHGGVFHIDDGKPTAALIGRTVENLKQAPPSAYFDVPAGYDALLPFLEGDEAFARTFFGGLDFLFSAAAALPRGTRDRLIAVARAATGEPPLFATGWGSTETAPSVTLVHFPNTVAENLGVPVPGAEVKMVPLGDAMELRVRGPGVMPGYLDQPEATAAAFDEEGFYRIGDAGRLIDPERPELGIAFAGRVAENFKLSSGTWVAAGAVRLAAIAAGRPLVADAVVTGHDRDQLGVMVFLNLSAAQALGGDAEAETVIRQGLQTYNADLTGGSMRIVRFRILEDPPSLGAGEITDKGYLNQRAILTNRRALVDAMYQSEHYMV